MSVIAIGINHNTAPVELREKVAFSTEQIVDALVSLKDATAMQGGVIVSTCNRTEIYVNGDATRAADVVKWLANYHGLELDELKANSYAHTEQDAVVHIMRVASGLDSMILGEPQVLGQVKQAYTSAKHSGSMNGLMDRLFQQTFAIAKRVRSETDIGANAVSVAFAAVQLAKHIFSSLASSKVLLVGAGDTIELVAKHLKEHGVNQITVANRTLAKADALACEMGGQGITLSMIPSRLHDADIVISSTASQLPILGKGMVENALKQRRNRPVFLVDLAVPRDIEPEVAEIDGAYLYTVDDLQHIVEKNIATRQEAADQATQMVVEQATAFIQWTQSSDANDLIKSVREFSESAKDKLVTRALNQLAEGQAAEEVVIELANKLANSVLHHPTQLIKELATPAPQARMSSVQADRKSDISEPDSPGASASTMIEDGSLSNLDKKTT